jgi:Arc/MetJ-type ribon-helix-helix transcriptional regulator
MVPGMATRKLTITLPDDQIEEIRALIKSGKSSNVSAFVKHAVRVALADAKGFHTMIEEALEQTGGPLTDKELAWVASISEPKKHRRPRRRNAA